MRGCHWVVVAVLSQELECRALLRPGGPIKTALNAVVSVNSSHSHKMRPVWQRLTRSHRLFISSHCHPVFLPFRFRPSPSEAPLVHHLLRSYPAATARCHGTITRPQPGTGYVPHPECISFSFETLNVPSASSYTFGIQRDNLSKPSKPVREMTSSQ
jgi:hypothetical protein